MIKLFLLSLFVTSIMFAQEILPDRKGKLFFKLGTEYRITPLPTDGESTNPRFSGTNSDLQNSGAAIYYGLDFFILQNLSLGFEHSFRYTLLNYNNSDVIGVSNTESTAATNSLFVGYHFNGTYHFKIFKDSEIFVRVGISLLNRNSNFTYKERVFFDDGELLGTASSELSYNMQTKNYAIGYKKNKFEAVLGIYTTNDPPYFDRSVTYIIPYIKLGYTLGYL